MVNPYLLNNFMCSFVESIPYYHFGFPYKSRKEKFHFNPSWYIENVSLKPHFCMKCFIPIRQGEINCFLHLENIIIHGIRKSTKDVLFKEQGYMRKNLTKNEPNSVVLNRQYNYNKFNVLVITRIKTIKQVKKSVR